MSQPASRGRTRRADELLQSRRTRRADESLRSRHARQADELPEGAQKRRVVQQMFDDIAPRYDLLNRLLTLRLDVRWRRRTVRDLRLPPQSTVADLACGTGDFCRELKARGHRAVGFDLSMGMLQAAARAAPLVHCDVLALPLPAGSLDGAVSGFALRNLVGVPPFFAELARVVRPGGRIGLLEVDEPSNAVLRWSHGLYFRRVVPLVGAMLSDRSAYSYLPRSVAYLPSAQDLKLGLAEAGFANVEHRRLTGGIAQLLTATRRR